MLYILAAMAMAVVCTPAYAQNNQGGSEQPRMDLVAAGQSVAQQGYAEPAKNAQGRFEKLNDARLVLMKMRARLNVSDSLKINDTGRRKKPTKNILPDGETLLLQPVLRNNIRPEGFILSTVHNEKILLSLSDFIDSMNVSLSIDSNNGSVEGWIFNEDRTFNLDFEQRRLDIAQRSFQLSEDVIFQDGDILVPSGELGGWIDADVDVIISSQELHIRSAELLPIEARMIRQSRNFQDNKISEPSLPLTYAEHTLVSVPAIDVTTNAQLRKRSVQDDTQELYTASVRTVQDFAKGTLNTLTRLDDRDTVSSVRATYSRESLQPDLLGPLNARKFEFGDVTTTDTPFGGNVRQEIGARVTNADPLRNFTQPVTDITGYAIPGWNVELYRDTQLLDFQDIGDDGFYRFTNVDLFLNDNNFRLVFYGPQGERREETLFIPFDSTLLAQGGRDIYDVTVSLNNTNTFDSRLFGRSDEGEVNVAALYERPLAPGLTLSLSGDTFVNNSERSSVGGIGLTSVIGEFLLSGDLGVDDEADISLRTFARRSFGQHDMSAAFLLNQAGFDQENGELDVFSEALEENVYGVNFDLNGPVVRSKNYRSQYNFSSDYSWNDGDFFSLTTNAGLSGGWRNYNLSANIRHRRQNDVDDFVNLTTSAFGIFGKSRFRLTGNYNIEPENTLRSVQASYNRRLTPNLNHEFSVSREEFTSITEFRSRLDWQAKFIRLSPSVSYNTNDDFFIGLTTRFGLLHEPHSNSIELYDRNVTSFGMASAFVFLDRNGDGLFNDGDEPLPDVKVSAPQNGRNQSTDEKGVALFSRMARLRQTDIFIDKESLQDPTWVSAFEGVSVLPRPGYVAEVQFPIHLGGEIDGTVMQNPILPPLSERGADFVAPPPHAVRNVNVLLYNDKGEIEQTSVTDSTGFYYFSAVPPGRYLLLLSQKSADLKNFMRPEPQQIEIGYDGTVLYDNKIFVLPGEGDVPSVILSDLSDYEARHAHIKPPVGEHDIVLNLGEYNSRLLMSVVWYKLRSRFADSLKDGILYVPPAESYAQLDTGKHVLRVGLVDENYEGAYNRCRALIVQDQVCQVEIIPAYRKEAQESDAEDGKRAELNMAANISPL